MALKVKEIACVARGTFNIYIFQPNWLQTFLDLSVERDIQLAADFREPGLQVSFDRGNLTWTIRPDALIVSSPSAEQDCGGIVAKVLNKLPLTPMKAVGSNFVFSGGRASDLSDDLLAAFWLDGRAKAGELQQSVVAGSVVRDGAIYNLSVVKAADTVEMQVNVHREATACEGCSKAASAFLGDLTRAVELAKSLFDLKVELS